MSSTYWDDHFAEIRVKTIAQQRAKRDTYLALVAQNLPVPPDLKAEMEDELDEKDDE